MSDGLAAGKLVLALAAAAWALCERRTPLSPSGRRFVWLALAALAVAAYFGELRPGARLVHLPDQYHYFMGARYFPEVGYSRLYTCSLVAESELGRVPVVDARGEERVLDLTAEARDPGRRVRDVGRDNLLVRVADAGFLDHPEVCTRRFSPERWAAFKADVLYFRVTAGPQAWADMQKDHGFNPPPVWLIAGRSLASLGPARTDLLERLAYVDLGLLAVVFVALAWAFGWRVGAVALVLWGCQAPASFAWTGGSFLRQDWLALLVLAACAARKECFRLAGACLAGAALLRVFPALVGAGCAVVVAAHLWRRGRLARPHRHALLGAALAVAVLVPASVAVCGPGAWGEFRQRTLGVHNRTWTSNLMGLSVAVAYPTSPRLEESLDRARVDASEPWRQGRAEGYRRWRFVAYLLGAAGVAFFVASVRRVRSLWVAACLAPALVVWTTQLSCYYYAFLVLAAPLAVARARLTAPVLAFAAATQAASLLLPWPDDRYAALSLLTSVFYLALVGACAAPEGSALKRKG